jgi:6-pyruvoyltetrahydropterin/6-carboxytetrahydropterin synthase
MYKISKVFTFEASHRLERLPVSHKCNRFHGHSYKVEVVVKSPCLDDRGFCQVDYAEMQRFKDYIDQACDHRHLNDQFPDIEPTAENLSRVFATIARKLISPYVSEVRVSETGNTWASYEIP